MAEPAPLTAAAAAATATATWSTELDRGLRSPKLAVQLETILQMGPRLRQWAAATAAKDTAAAAASVNSAYGGGSAVATTPPETAAAPGGSDGCGDVTQANALVLRLADAFRAGSDTVRLCVLQVFLQHLQAPAAGGQDSNGGNNGSDGGLLAPGRLLNPGLVLGRILEVATPLADPPARALALRALGAAACLAANSAGVHELVLDALASPQPVEVAQAEATFSAAARFCRVSANFAAAALDKVRERLLGSGPGGGKHTLAAAWLLGHMSGSPQLALTAQTVGEEALQERTSASEVATILRALTKLAVCSIVTLWEQVQLLASVAAGDLWASVRMVALAGLRQLAPQANRCGALSTGSAQALVALAMTDGLAADLHSSALGTIGELLQGMAMAGAVADDPDFLPSLELTITEQAADSQLALDASRVLVSAAASLATVTAEGLALRTMVLLCEQVGRLAVDLQPESTQTSATVSGDATATSQTAGKAAMEDYAKLMERLAAAVPTVAGTAADELIAAAQDFANVSCPKPLPETKLRAAKRVRAAASPLPVRWAVAAALKHLGGAAGGLSSRSMSRQVESADGDRIKVTWTSRVHHQ
eukprot:SM000066S20398  [mRNA]  locus=s66:6604:10311:- [translate_table: standard]